MRKQKSKVTRLGEQRLRSGPSGLEKLGCPGLISLPRGSSGYGPQENAAQQPSGGRTIVLTVLSGRPPPESGGHGLWFPVLPDCWLPAECTSLEASAFSVGIAPAFPSS